MGRVQDVGNMQQAGYRVQQAGYRDRARRDETKLVNVDGGSSSFTEVNQERL